MNRIPIIIAMDNKGTPAIFLSYARKDDAYVNIIDIDFMAIGIRLNRDILDIPYKSDINEYMNQIMKSDYVLIMISDAFLKSKYSRYEVLQLLKLPDFLHRILPVVL
ncbi:MAG: toll/interleukin-1 receptor domain-containing protein [Chitinophagales bacterium]